MQDIIADFSRSGRTSPPKTRQRFSAPVKSRSHGELQPSTVAQGSSLVAAGKYGFPAKRLSARSSEILEEQDRLPCPEQNFWQKGGIDEIKEA